MKVKNETDGVKVLRPYTNTTKTLVFPGKGTSCEFDTRIKSELKHDVAKNIEKWMKEHGISAVEEVKVEVKPVVKPVKVK